MNHHICLYIGGAALVAGYAFGWWLRSIADAIARRDAERIVRRTQW